MISLASVLAKLRGGAKSTKEDQIRRGQNAARLMKDETFQAAMEAVQEDLFSGLLVTTPEQAAKREEIYHSLRALESVAAKLEAAVNNGAVEAREKRHLQVV
jgi:hypothetical protein